MKLQLYLVAFALFGVACGIKLLISTANPGVKREIKPSIQQSPQRALMPADVTPPVLSFSFDLGI